MASDSGGDLGRLGNYKLLSKLGEGGMGAVFLAEHAVTSRPVAIKVLSSRHAGNTEFVSRFRREANAAATLKHENIVAATASGEEDGRHFYVMEYFDGEPLDKVLQRQGCFPALKAASIVRQIALGLKHAHENGVLHRDIKPANIFLTREGVAKILDLGLSKNIEAAEQSFNTESGVTLGTPHYISPEQARGERELDGRTDIYSLGATFYHLVTGETPFKGPTAAVVMTKHLNEQLENPKDIRPDIPAGVVHVICKMMGKAPANRYDDCAALLEDLDSVLAGKLPASVELEAQLSTIAMPRQSQQGAKRKLPLWSALIFPPLLLVILIQRWRQFRFSLRTLLLLVLLIGAVGAFWHVLPEWVLRHTLPHKDPVNSAVFSPDGRRLVTTIQNGQLQCWSTDTGEKNFDVIYPSDGMTRVAFSPDGGRIAILNTWTPVVIAELTAKPKSVVELKGHTRFVNSAAFSPDGKQVVTAAGNELSKRTDVSTGAELPLPPEDNTARIWDAASGKQLMELSGHQGSVLSAEFSSDGTKVVTASRDKTARVWDARTGKQLALMSGHSDDVRCATFRSNDAQVYTISRDDTFRRWSATDGTAWEIHTQQTVVEPGKGPYHKNWGRFFAFAPENSAGTVTSDCILSPYWDNSVAVWWVHNGELRTVLEGHKDYLMGGDFSKDGKYIVTASHDQTAKVWESHSARNSPYGIFRAVTFLLMVLFAGLLVRSVWQDNRMQRR